MAREATAKVSLTYRLSEQLRGRLEQAAKSEEQSLNNEITRRLRWTFDEEAVYGKKETSVLARLVGTAIHATEIKLKQRWHESPVAAAACRQAALSVIEVLMKAPNLLTVRGEEFDEMRAATMEGREVAIDVLTEEVRRLAAEQDLPHPPREAIAEEVGARTNSRKKK